MCTDMKKKPPYFDKVQEYYLEKDDDAETATPPPSREESPETIKLPTVLPPDYDILLKENGIIEDKPPVSAPCFNDAPDPSGRKPWLGIAVR